MSAIYDLQFTTASSLSVAPGAPYIPATTYTLADSTSTSTYVAWNHAEITYLQGLSFAGPNGVAGNISDSAMQTFFPFDYAPNEDYESGAWMFEGSITVAPTLANLSISDGGGTTPFAPHCGQLPLPPTVFFQRPADRFALSPSFVDVSSRAIANQRCLRQDFSSRSFPLTK